MKKCPFCKLLHPDGGLRCECGFDFRVRHDRAALRALFKQASAKAPFRSRPIAALIYLLGVFFGIIAPLAIAIFGQVMISWHGNNFVVACIIGAITGICASMAVAAATTLSQYFFRLARRLAARKGDHALLKDPRSPVLYLRSFDRDAEGGHFCDPLEDRLITVFTRVGPLVAVGRPREHLRTPGASRLYIKDDHWKSMVTRLLELAEGVVYVHGDTDGLTWELTQIRDKIDPRRLLLVVPVATENSLRSAEKLLRTIFPRVVDDEVSNFRLFVFASDWTPIPLRYKYVSGGQVFANMNGFERFSTWVLGLSVKLYGGGLAKLSERSLSYQATLMPFASRLISLTRN